MTTTKKCGKLYKILLAAMLMAALALAAAVFAGCGAGGAGDADGQGDAGKGAADAASEAAVPGAGGQDAADSDSAGGQDAADPDSAGKDAAPPDLREEDLLGGGDASGSTEGPDLQHIDNGYGTVFVRGRRIEHPADTSTSIVEDLRDEPAAKASRFLKVEETKGIVYARSTHTDGHHKGSPLDLHLNLKVDAKAKDPQPVILFVPGGGFITCRIDDKYEGIHRYLIDHGYAVAIMEYHIIGQGRYQDAADDVRAAIAWVKAHGTEYGLDPKRIALMGNSGGGYVADLAACQDPADIRCVVNFYGLCDILNNKADYEDEAIEAHHRPNSSDSQFVNGALSGKSLTDDPQEAHRADPITYVDGNEPPFLHFHGTEDLLVSPSQSLHLHEALLAQDEESTRYVLTGEGHASKGFRSRTALDQALDFLDRHCRK